MIVDRQTRIFTVRFWSDARDGQMTEWRGQVRDAISHEAQYFRDWETLLQFFAGSLAEDHPVPLRQDNSKFVGGDPP